MAMPEAITFPLESWFPEGLINNPSQHEGALFPHPPVRAAKSSKENMRVLCGIFSTHVKETVFIYYLLFIPLYF